MTLQELLLGSIQSNQSAAIMSLGAKPANNALNQASNDTFKDILKSKTVDGKKNSGAAESCYEKSFDSKYSDRTVNNYEGRQRYNKYTDVQKTNSTDKASSPQKPVSLKREDVSSERDLVKETTEAVDEMTFILAQIFGVGANELQRLLNEAGVNLESIECLDENISKLSQLLNLSENQEQALVKLIQIAENALQASETVQARDADYSLSGGGESTLGAYTTQEGAKQASDSMTIEDLANKLNVKIAVKLNELSEKLEKDYSQAESEISRIIQPMLSKASMKIQELSNQSVETQETEASEQGVLIEGDAKAAKQEDSTENRGNTNQRQHVEGDQTVPGFKDSHPHVPFTMAQPENIIDRTFADAVFEKVPIAPREIINQVVEKANLIMTSEKSEMTMELKPESLGKISLKIITENGIITAKFVAESQQVKHALESNMEFLKESLERQGMNVEGFTVSVRQDSQQPSQQFASSEGAVQRPGTDSLSKTVGINGNTEALSGVIMENNPYHWEGSTINLTA